MFEIRTVTDGTITALTEALASKKPNCPNLVLKTDNGSQYVSAVCQAVKAYDVR